MARARHRGPAAPVVRWRPWGAALAVAAVVTAVVASGLEGPSAGRADVLPAAAAAVLHDADVPRLADAGARSGDRSAAAWTFGLSDEPALVTPAPPAPVAADDEADEELVEVVADAGVSDAACPISAQVEAHLTARAVSVYRAVCAVYGDAVSSFGGYRAGDSGDHGSGRAVDIMVSGEPGRQIARFVQDHAAQFGVDYVIYQQQIWMAGDPVDAWSAMADRGSATANHFDHVHVSVT